MKIHNITSYKKILNIEIVGGKCLPIFEMGKNNIPIPISYSIGYDFFEKHLKDINFWNKIDINSLESNNKNLGKELEFARKIILQSNLDIHFLNQLIEIKDKSDFWAVRSSANIEDAKNKSWAGVFESYVGVKKSSLEEYIKKVWVSIFSERVINYISNPKDIKNIKMAILLQKAINADVSGVCFTRDPFSNELDQMIIEAVHGMGEYLVQGEVIPDRYIVDKEGGLILEVNFNKQYNKLKFSGKGELEKVKNEKRAQQKLEGKEIIELYEISKKIEGIYNSPRDIEWCYSNGYFYILQSRPITS